MSKEMKSIPELRFPEFKDDLGWKYKRLGEDDVSTILRGGSPRPISEFITNDENGLNWLKIGDVNKKSKFVIKTEEKVLPTALSKTREVYPGDLIMSNSMSFGRPYILKIQTCIHDGWIAITEINEKINTEFLYYLILSDSSQSYFANSAAGGGIKNLNAEIVKKLPVVIPSVIKEQQKIASCLSSLDELIGAHKDKLEALKDHKKGLMQNLFPQEGQKVPNYRFPEFNDDGEWEEKSVDNVFSIFQGRAFSSKDSTTHGARWLKIADVGIQEMKHDTPSYLPAHFKDEFKRYLLKKGDYVIALTRPILSRKLKIAQIDEVFHNSLLNQRVGKLVTDRVNDFVYYLLQTSELIDVISKNIAGNDPPNLSYQQISDIKVLITSKEEQQRISNCLLSVDELIAGEQEKIEQLQQHKKGLMQGLFPKIESE